MRMHSAIAGVYVCFLAAGCVSKEMQMWTTARDANTRTAYQGYLSAFPEGAHARVARSRIHDIDLNTDLKLWMKVKQDDTLAAYESYLADWPQGAYAAEARQRIAAQIAAQKAMEKTAAEVGQMLRLPSDTERIARFDDLLRADPLMAPSGYGNLARVITAIAQAWEQDAELMTTKPGEDSFFEHFAGLAYLPASPPAGMSQSRFVSLTHDVLLAMSRIIQLCPKRGHYKRIFLHHSVGRAAFVCAYCKNWSDFEEMGPPSKDDMRRFAVSSIMNKYVPKLEWSDDLTREYDTWRAVQWLSHGRTGGSRDEFLLSRRREHAESITSMTRTTWRCLANSMLPEYSSFNSKRRRFLLKSLDVWVRKFPVESEVMSSLADLRQVEKDPELLSLINALHQTATRHERTSSSR